MRGSSENLSTTLINFRIQLTMRPLYTSSMTKFCALVTYTLRVITIILFIYLFRKLYTGDPVSGPLRPPED